MLFRSPPPPLVGVRDFLRPVLGGGGVEPLTTSRSEGRGVLAVDESLEAERGSGVRFARSCLFGRGVLSPRMRVWRIGRLSVVCDCFKLFSKTHNINIILSKLEM